MQKTVSAQGFHAMVSFGFSSVSVNYKIAQIISLSFGM